MTLPSRPVRFTPLNAYQATVPSDLSHILTSIQTNILFSRQAGLWFVRLLPIYTSVHFPQKDSWRKNHLWHVFFAEVEKSRAGHPIPEVKIQRASKFSCLLFVRLFWVPLRLIASPDGGDMDHWNPIYTLKWAVTNILILSASASGVPSNANTPQKAVEA
jgi:hypothetical protein